MIAEQDVALYREDGYLGVREVLDRSEVEELRRVTGELVEKARAVSAHDRRVMAFPGQSECEVLARLFGIEGASVPVPGLGSTDCRRCPSHLLALDRAGLAALPDRLALD